VPGIDMFDCVLPTRNARNGWLFTPQRRDQAAQQPLSHDLQPVDEQCTCYTCGHFTRAYLHHLQRVNEMLGAQLNTVHNLHYFQEIMADLRAAIEQARLRSSRSGDRASESD
jgi:queuine tRNA-ribosyltransferase